MLSFKCGDAFESCSVEVGAWRLTPTLQVMMIPSGQTGGWLPGGGWGRLQGDVAQPEPCTVGAMWGATGRGTRERLFLGGCLQDGRVYWWSLHAGHCSRLTHTFNPHVKDEKTEPKGMRSKVTKLVMVRAQIWIQESLLLTIKTN